MARFETRVFRVMVSFDGGDYHLQAMVQKEDWSNVDHLGEMGWEFVAFVPDHEIFIKDSFPTEMLPLIRMAVFKRELDEDEEMFGDYKYPSKDPN